MKGTLKFIAASVLGSSLTIAVFMMTGITKGEPQFSIPQANTPVHRAVYSVNEDGQPVPLDFTGVSENVMQSVVHVKMSRTVEVQNSPYFQSPWGDMGGDDIFKFFFGEPQGRQQQRRERQPFKQEGSGSGVIISPDGYIVTNNHVVDGADDIEVTLYDNKVYKAKVVGTDPSTDVAVIRIKADGLHALPMGNSDKVQVGEWVLAVGNPFNLNSTVTAGIISAKGRNINIINNKSAIEAFLQTDAAINPGNSGGALVDLNGNLVGINTAIASPTGTYAGYGFAIPTSIVSKVVDDIMKYGMVQRAYLGVMIQDVNGDLEKDKNLKVSEGAYVDSLVENSAAGQVGIKPGDVIVQVDDKAIMKSADLLEEIGTHRPGDDVKVKVNRKGKEMTYDVQLANQKGVKKLVSREKADVFDLLGATFETLDKDKAEELGIDGGAVLTDLGSGILKSQTNIREGYIVTGVNKKEIGSVEDLRKELEKDTGGVLFEGIYPDYPGVVFYAFGLDK